MVIHERMQEGDVEEKEEEEEEKVEKKEEKERETIVIVTYAPIERWRGD